MLAMKLTRPPECLSDLVLDEHLAGELDAPARAEADAHLVACARCQQRRTGLQREHAAFLERAPSLHASGRDARPARATRIRILSLAGALAAAAAVALTWHTPGLEPPLLETRSKGAPRLGFFVSRDGKVVRGIEGQTVHPGDRLRFTYSADRALHLAVLDRDTRAASVFFPSGPRAAQIPAGQDVALDFSVELDAQLGDERVHAVFCPEAFEVEPLRAALDAGRDPPVASKCTVSVIHLHKVSRP